MLVEVGSALFLSIVVAAFFYSMGTKHGERQQQLKTIKIRLHHGPSGLLEYTEELRHDRRHQKTLQFLTKGYWPSTWDGRKP